MLSIYLTNVIADPKQKLMQCTYAAQKNEVFH